jgi:hypothetical protein
VAERLTLQKLQTGAVGMLAAGALAVGVADDTAQAEVNSLSAENTPALKKGLPVGRAAIGHYSDLKPVPANCQAPEDGSRVTCPTSFNQCARELNRYTLAQGVGLTINPAAKSNNGRTISAWTDFELTVFIPPRMLNVFTDPKTGQQWQRECDGDTVSTSYLQVKAGKRKPRPFHLSGHRGGMVYSNVTVTTKDRVWYGQECRTGEQPTLQFFQQSTYTEGQNKKSMTRNIPVWRLPCETGKRGRIVKH